jgi:hypothetical protein
MSWLDLVPVSTDAYAYDAALLCEDCGQKAADDLRGRGVEDTGDSGDFPQGPYPDGGGESDSAQFCDRGKQCVNAVQVERHKFGCPLGNPLTTDGALAVRESVVDDMFSRKKYSRLVGRLLRRVWSDYLDSPPVRVKPRYADQLPDSLLHWCKVLHSRYTNAQDFDSRVYADADHAYLIYKHGAAVVLCRSEVDDDGEFADFEVYELPLAELEGRDPEAVFAAAVSDMVWD